jgi:vanillate O-demethylase ferredoxin subunit
VSIQTTSCSDWLQVQVSAKTAIAEGVMLFELRASPEDLLPPFTAGSHIDIALPNGLIRQYSLCNSPDDRKRYEIAVLLEPSGRGGSRSAHLDLQPGDTVRIGVPRNMFPLVNARHSILVAGGIGVTPILSMAEHLARNDVSFELHYCSRSAARTAFLERIQSSAFANRARVYIDDDDGRLDVSAVLRSPSPETHLYVCGPTGFMDYVIHSANGAGWEDRCVHKEYFAAGTIDEGKERAFEVVLASTGRVVPVTSDQTVVQALALHGITVPVSCEQGFCGTCAIRILDGVPDHRDSFLSDEAKAANDCFTPCCSRAKSARLVVDY